MKKHHKEDSMNIKEKLASSSKKERTPQQQKAMTILNWAATAVCIIVIIFALIMAIFMIAGSGDKEYRITRFGDKIYLNVATDSMEPEFYTSDVLIANSFNPGSQLDELKIGQVITFKTTSGLYKVLNTHRIVKINRNDDGSIRNFTTRGDNSKSADKDNSKLSWKDAIAQNDLGLTETVAPSNIVATWGSVDENGNFTAGKMLKGAGTFANWIQDVGVDKQGVMHYGENMKTRFFCVVVLPLILLFVIYAFILVRTLVIAKLENQRKVQSEQVITVDSLSDEEKRRLAQEYLASLQAQTGGDTSDTKADDAQTDETSTDKSDSSDVSDGNASEDKPE